MHDYCDSRGIFTGKYLDSFLYLGSPQEIQDISLLAGG